MLHPLNIMSKPPECWPCDRVVPSLFIGTGLDNIGNSAESSVVRQPREVLESGRRWVYRRQERG